MTALGFRLLSRPLCHSNVAWRASWTFRRSVSSADTPLKTYDGGAVYDAVYDVVVVGSGCSGLATAVTAAKHGLKVLVLEKTRYFGGTTAYSGGGAWIPNNHHQPSIGVQDSSPQAEIYLQQVLGDLYDKEKIQTYINSAPQMAKWMEANSQVRFKPVPLPDYHVSKKGASIGRTLLTKEFDGRKLRRLVKDVRYPIQGYSAFGTMQADPAELSILTNPFKSFANLFFATRKVLRYLSDLAIYGKGTAMANGNALVGQLLYSAQLQGVQMWNHASAVKTVQDQGRVIGLDLVKEGKNITVQARKGVVLASGGFGRSQEARDFVPHDWCAAPRGNTGDGKRIGVESGGSLPPKNPMNAIFAPISLLKVSNGPVRRFPHFAIDRSKPGSIIVGPDGRRFANESEPYQEFVTTMHQKGIEKAYYIGDRTHLRKYGMGMALPSPYPIGRLLRQNYLLQAPTIPDLAQKIGVPVDTLQETVAEYNSFARTGQDTQFHRGETIYDQFYGDPIIQPNSNLRPCETGPFYALPLYPGNVSTLYGLNTNVDAQVLDEQGQAIDGLFAVGCDQNSVFKGAYPGGGSSIGPGMTFGYRAGLKLAGVQP